mmetsp:Transcript_3795/g.8359  ORF Transcript_3795/g.8359 Transcript_3795/m.8359 type:complete len:250 (+) Transcript_3795:563-1312(+)
MVLLLFELLLVLLRLGGRCEHALSVRAMSFTAGILLKRVLHRNGPPTHVLPVHSADCVVRGRERRKLDKAKVFRLARIDVARDMRRINQLPKRAEHVVQRLLIHVVVQVAHKQIRADVELLALHARQLHAYGFVVQTHHIHDLCGVLRVLHRLKLHKPVPMRGPRDSITRNVHVSHPTHLRHQLPQQRLTHTLLQPTNIHRRALVPIMLARVLPNNHPLHSLAHPHHPFFLCLSLSVSLEFAVLCFAPS